MTASAASTTYPHTITTRDGRTIAVRRMEPSDGNLILGFAGALPTEDLVYLRSDITTPAGINEWVQNLQRGNTVSLLAFDGDHLIGYASVHRSPVAWTRRVGEIRVNIAPSYRRLGVGRRLTEEIFALAPGLGLHKLTAQMTTTQAAARRVFEQLGFREEAVLHGWVEDRLGTPHNLAILTYDLQEA